MSFLGVVHGVANDVGDVIVGELVGDLAAASDAFDKVGAAENAKVLADQRLRQPEAVDQLVDAAFAVGKLSDQRHSNGRS